MKKNLYTMVAIAMLGTTTAFAGNHRETVSHHDSRHNVVVVEQPRHGGHSRGHYVEPRHHGDVRVIRVNNPAPAPRTVVVERNTSNAAAGVIVGAAILGAVIGALAH